LAFKAPIIDFAKADMLILDEIEGPCPSIDAGRYKFKIEAVNENGVIIGMGSRERYFPEEK